MYIRDNGDRNRRSVRRLESLLETNEVIGLKKVTTKSFLSWSSPIASKHSVFPLTEVQASELPGILTKYVSKEVTSEAADKMYFSKR